MTILYNQNKVSVPLRPDEESYTASLSAYPNNPKGVVNRRDEQTSKKRARERAPNNHTTTGFRISDELWAVLQLLLPRHVNTHRFGGGRPRVPDRDCADAIFYVLRTGCQWQALDQTELCAHSTAHDRFQEWVQAGVFLKLNLTQKKGRGKLERVDLRRKGRGHAKRAKNVYPRM